MLIAALGIVVYSDVSYAATLQADSEFGETVYSIDSQAVWSPTSSTPTRFTATDSIGTWTLNGYKACIWRSSYKTSYIGIEYDYYLYVYNKNGYVEISSLSISDYGVTSGTCVRGNRDLSNWTNVDKNVNYNYLYLEVHLRTYEDIEWSHLITNIPIFESEEQAISFMTGDGTVTEKDAINYEDCSPCIYGDIEVPQDVKLDLPGGDFFNSNHDYKLTWTQTDEKYIDWDTEILIYSTFQGRPSFLFFPLGEWIEYKDKLIYTDKIKCYRLKYTFKEEDEFKWQNEWLNSNAIDDAVNEVESLNLYIFMRNKYFDGIKMHYSNWIKISVDCMGNGITTKEEVASGVIEEFVYDKNYNEEENDFVNKMPEGSINPDSIYDGTDVQEGSSGSADGLIGYISNGFGLLGDSGVIAVMSDFFSYVPDFVWSIVGVGLSLMVIIGVAKYIF